MDPITDFMRMLPNDARLLFDSLTSPERIQAFLDSIPYRSEEVYLSPYKALIDREANCFDGALLAIAALRRLGHPPLLLQLVAERDDEHLLAIYERDGHLGSIAKSNFVGLRYREPVYRTLRELVMSYFEVYFNIEGEKSLRGYTRPVDMRQYDHLEWMWRDEAMPRLLAHLERLHRVPVISESMARALAPMDKRSMEAHMMGVNLAGVYVPEPRGD